MWQSIALLAIGFIGGAITWNYIDIKTVYKGVFKTKQRGRGNIQNTEVNADLPTQTKREERKSKRKAKKDDRKENRAHKAGSGQ